MKSVVVDYVVVESENGCGPEAGVYLIEEY
jgi:hypothetical protein